MYNRQNASSQGLVLCLVAVCALGADYWLCGRCGEAYVASVTNEAAMRGEDGDSDREERG